MTKAHQRSPTRSEEIRGMTTAAQTAFLECAHILLSDCKMPGAIVVHGMFEATLEVATALWGKDQAVSLLKGLIDATTRGGPFEVCNGLSSGPVLVVRTQNCEIKYKKPSAARADGKDGWTAALAAINGKITGKKRH